MSREALHRISSGDDQLAHARILTNKSASTKLKANQAAALPAIVDAYVRYQGMVAEHPGNIAAAVKGLNSYYDFLSNNGYSNIFSAQTKFRPTILEEFMYLLFKRDIEEINRSMPGGAEGRLGLGAIKAYARLHLSPDNLQSFITTPEANVHVKDQDFAIYRSLELNVEGTRYSVKVPIVAIENKTYLDKTMLESSVATAEKVKSGNHNAQFLIVSEAYDVAYTEDPSNSKIDEIFVLRKCKRAEFEQQGSRIHTDVVELLHHRVMKHLRTKWSDIENNIKTKGVVFGRAF